MKAGSLKGEDKVCLVGWWVGFFVFTCYWRYGPLHCTRQAVAHLLAATVKMVVLTGGEGEGIKFRTWLVGWLLGWLV